MPPHVFSRKIAKSRKPTFLNSSLGFCPICVKLRTYTLRSDLIQSYEKNFVPLKNAEIINENISVDSTVCVSLCPTGGRDPSVSPASHGYSCYDWNAFSVCKHEILNVLMIHVLQTSYLTEVSSTFLC